MKRDAHPTSLPFLTFRAPSKGNPLQVPQIELPYREMLKAQSPLSANSHLVEGPPNRAPT